MSKRPVGSIWNTEESSFSRQIHQNINDISLELSGKQSGCYSSLVTETGIRIFPEIEGGKQPKRRFYNIGALRASAGTDITAHGINYFTEILRIWGVANKVTAAKKSIPIPHASSTAADIVELYLDATNINIVVGKDMSAYTAYVYIEYLLD